MFEPAVTSHFVIPVTAYNNFLSHFLRINFELRETCSFCHNCNKFFQEGPKRASEVLLSLFVIKTVITKNLDIIQIFGQMWSKF